MNTTPRLEVTQIAEELRHLHLLCETPADFADVDEILAGLADEKRAEIEAEMVVVFVQLVENEEGEK